MKNIQIDPSETNNLSNLSNKQLYQLCQKWGADTRKWMKKFASLLPEVEKRELYRDHGFYSIYEFAAKLAGMSNANVNDVLRTHRKVEDKPALKELIATEGWSKIKVVASIATVENEKEIAKRVKEMSKSSLETFAREIRNQESCPGISIPKEMASESQSEFEKETKTTTLSFKVSESTEFELRKIKQKLEKEQGTLLTWEQTMKLMIEKLQKCESRGCKTKKRKDVDCEAREKKKDSKKKLSLEQIQKSLPKKSSRYIPAKVKNYIHQKHKGRCAYPNCKKPSEIMHHTRRYALNPNHDPQFIKPLCKNHERLAHHTLIAHETSDSEKWKVRLRPATNTDRYRIDQKVQQYRQAALL